MANGWANAHPVNLLAEALSQGGAPGRRKRGGGGAGTRPPQLKNQRGRPPEVMIFQYLFSGQF